MSDIPFYLFAFRNEALEILGGLCGGVGLVSGAALPQGHGTGVLTFFFGVVSQCHY